MRPMIIPLGRSSEQIAEEARARAEKHQLARHVRQTRRSYKRAPAEDVTAALEETGGRVAVAASSLGVHRATLYRWLAQDPELAAAVREAYLRAVAVAAEHLET